MISRADSIHFPVQPGETLLEVERSGNVSECQPQANHGKSNLRLNPDDNRCGATKPGHLTELGQRPHGERIQDIQRRDVDDDASGPENADLFDERAPQDRELVVAQRILHCRDQVIALLENGHSHGASRNRARWVGRNDFVAEQPLGLLDAALQVA
ncbi:MAG TPA: hypothetical protein VEK56_07255, partial [Vicinamibacterales bacterium]|nr:hypothetical protein [Vicinamibacterales bacterium]